MSSGTHRLRDIAERENLSVERGTPLRQLLRLMHENKKGVVVVLSGSRPVGIVTERDVVGLLHACVDLDGRAGDYAAKPLIVTSGDRTLGYALNLMLENNIRRLVVVDGAMAFLGVVTQADLVRHLEEDFYRASLRVKHMVDKLKSLVGATPEETVRDVLDRMVRHRVGCVPILREGKAVGIVTERDIVKLADSRSSLDDAVERCMSSPVVTADLETSIVEIVKTMNAKDIRRVVVIDPCGNAAGVLTARDLVRNLESDYGEFLERKLKYTKEVLNLLPEMLIEIVDTGAEQIVLWANEKVLGRLGGTIIDRPVTQFVPEGRWEEVFSLLRAQGKVEDVKFKKDGSVYELSGFYLPLDRIDERGRVQLILRDITQEVNLATTDELTNVFNRRYANEFLKKEVERSRRTDRCFSVMMADIDDFKRINDSHGHPTGDRVLRMISEVLIRGVREYDLVGRYGGEEFLIVTPETSTAAAAQVAERLRLQVAGAEFRAMDGERISVTASFGIASYPEDGDSAEDLLVRADERLYVAKRAGKNRVVEGSPDVGSCRAERIWA